VAQPNDLRPKACQRENRIGGGKKGISSRTLEKRKLTKGRRGTKQIGGAAVRVGTGPRPLFSQSVGHLKDKRRRRQGGISFKKRKCWACQGKGAYLEKKEQKKKGDRAE